LNMPTRIRISRRGNQFTMYAAKGDEEMVPTGPATVVLEDPVYVGIGVCSHDANVLETAIFSNVRIETATTTYFRTPR
jgi:TolB protein